MIRLTLADIENEVSNSQILVKMGCIYRFSRTDRETGQEKHQIAVGIIEKVHDRPDSNEQLVDISGFVHQKELNRQANYVQTLCIKTHLPTFHTVFISDLKKGRKF